MKALKIVLLVVVSLVALVFIIPIFVNGNYAVEKQVQINQPKDVVFDYVKMLKNQDEFSMWAKMDPEMEKTFTGTDGTVGFISAWNSDSADVGRGEQEIMKIDEGNRIDFELRFFEPWESTDQAYMSTESVNDSVTIAKWGFTGALTYPMKGMLLFMDMEEMLGAQLQEGLDNLKEILE